MTMGLTAQMKRAFEGIMAFVGRHGAAPSLQSIADEVGVNKSKAASLVKSLHERGYVTCSGRGSIALGTGGVSIVVPAEIAAKLAQFCAAKDERVSAVVADAIALHLDQLEGPDSVGRDSVA